jgi:hypothetical protein
MSTRSVSIGNTVAIVAAGLRGTVLRTSGCTRRSPRPISSDK